MPWRKTYTVSRSGNGWKATESGGNVVASGKRKSDMVRDAAKVARQQPSASLRIQGRDGRIQDERTYPRSSDPRRSKG